MVRIRASCVIGVAGLIYVCTVMHVARRVQQPSGGPDIGETAAESRRRSQLLRTRREDKPRPAVIVEEAASPKASSPKAEETTVTEFEAVDPRRCAFAMLVCDDGSVLSAAVTIASLFRVWTKADVVAMVASEVSESARRALTAAGAVTYDAAKVRTPYGDNGPGITARMRKRCRYTKLRAWELVAYDRVIVIDTDMIVMNNIDHLFERRRLSAVPDIYPRIFNSGLMVITPDSDLADRLIDAAVVYRSYNQGDQGFLNAWFQDHPKDAFSGKPLYDERLFISKAGGVSWTPLDAAYNMDIATYTSWFGKQFGPTDVNVVHFSGQLKPWRLFGAVQDAGKSNWDGLYEPSLFLKWWRLADVVAEKLGCAARNLSLPVKELVQRGRRPKHQRKCGVEMCANASTALSCRPAYCEIRAKLFSTRRFERNTAKLTVAISTFRGERIPIADLVRHYANSSIVARVVVIWHDPETLPPASPTPKRLENGVLVTTLHQKTDSLNNRFTPNFDVGTKNVLICDDDIFVTLDSLAFAYRVAKQHPNKLISPFVRSHTILAEEEDEDTNSTSKKKYREGYFERDASFSSMGARQYSMALTKFVIAPAWLLFTYSCLLDPAVHAYVNALSNCEDIAFNLVAAAAGMGAPMMVDIPVTDYGERIFGEATVNMRISGSVDHGAERWRCVRDLERLVRADPKFDKSAKIPLKSASTAATRFVSTRVEYGKLSDLKRSNSSSGFELGGDQARVVLHRDAAVAIPVVESATVDANAQSGAEALEIAQGPSLNLRLSFETSRSGMTAASEDHPHFNPGFVEVFAEKSQSARVKNIENATYESALAVDDEADRLDQGEVLRNSAISLIKIRRRDLERLDRHDENRGVVLLDLVLTSTQTEGDLFNVDSLGVTKHNLPSRTAPSSGLQREDCPLRIFYAPKLPDNWTSATMNYAELARYETNLGAKGFFYPLTSLNTLVMLELRKLLKAHSRASSSYSSRPEFFSFAIFLEASSKKTNCAFHSTRPPNVKSGPRFELVKFRRPVS